MHVSRSLVQHRLSCHQTFFTFSVLFYLLCPAIRFMYRVKVGESLFPEASAPSKKAARQLAAEEAVKELMADGRLQVNKVRSGVTQVVHLRTQRGGLHIPKISGMTLEEEQITRARNK